jgi:homoserine/homoserine lactone efflux protein
LYDLTAIGGNTGRGPFQFHVAAEGSMNWQSWSLYLATEIALSLSPGPAVLLVLSQALRGGMARGIGAAVGILAANVVWFALSALGVGAAILAAGDLFLAIRWLGAAYLIYLAIRSAWGAFRPAAPDAVESVDSPPAGLSGGWGRDAFRGFVLQMTNPKALMFFVAILPQFIQPNDSLERQMLILGVTSIAAELPVLVLYSALASRARNAARDRRWARTIDLSVALLLAAAACGVALAG